MPAAYRMSLAWLTRELTCVLWGGSFSLVCVMRVFITSGTGCTCRSSHSRLLCVTLRMAGWQLPLLVAGRDDSPIPVADDDHEILPYSCNAQSMHCGCARARWAAHAAWHSAARARAPAHGEPLPHGSNATHAGSLARCGPVAPTTTTRACHSMLDRCTETAHE